MLQSLDQITSAAREDSPQDTLDTLVQNAPAKINLHLMVKNKRPDGFHDLESVFLALDFGDTLHFSIENDVSGAGNEKCCIDGVSIPDNIILKAVSLFRKKTGFSKGLKISAEKRIPLGGGLGGGSSDAAATLLALNKMTGSPLKRESLLELAAALGSDVPFFIHETAAAWVTGRGEIIEPIKVPDMSLLLVNPGFQSSTKTAFRLLDEQRWVGVRSKNNPSSLLTSTSSLVTFFSSFGNDFLKVFPEREKAVYNDIISQLRELGAVYANLSGTGSTCFGVFSGDEQAQETAHILKNRWKFVEFCRSKTW